MPTNSLCMTYCSKQKLQKDIAQDLFYFPKQLYLSRRICLFIAECEELNLTWSIFSDKYGLVFENDKLKWYDKAPDSVSKDEYVVLYHNVLSKVYNYDRIVFFYEKKSFHPLYKQLVSDLQGHILVDLKCMVNNDGKNE